MDDNQVIADILSHLKSDYKVNCCSFANKPDDWIVSSVVKIAFFTRVFDITKQICVNMYTSHIENSNTKKFCISIEGNFLNLYYIN